MKPVHFIQFMRPDGRQVLTYIMMPDEIAERALKIKQAGYRFEIEHLMTGFINMTISTKDQDCVQEIVPNNEEVVKAVERMINKGYMELLSQG